MYAFPTQDIPYSKFLCKVSIYANYARDFNYTNTCVLHLGNGIEKVLRTSRSQILLLDKNQCFVKIAPCIFYPLNGSCLHSQLFYTQWLFVRSCINSRDAHQESQNACSSQQCSVMG